MNSLISRIEEIQKELEEWKKKHIGKTMRMKRIDFLNQNIQKSGNS